MCCYRRNSEKDSDDEASEFAYCGLFGSKMGSSICFTVTSSSKLLKL
jgi:hypothetical protein